MNSISISTFSDNIKSNFPRFTCSTALACRSKFTVGTIGVQKFFCVSRNIRNFKLHFGFLRYLLGLAAHLHLLYFNDRSDSVLQLWRGCTKFWSILADLIGLAPISVSLLWKCTFILCFLTNAIIWVYGRSWQIFLQALVCNPIFSFCISKNTLHVPRGHEGSFCTVAVMVGTGAMAPNAPLAPTPMPYWIIASCGKVGADRPCLNSMSVKPRI